MIGFCWGSWAVFKESERGSPFCCGVNCHPSLKIEEMLGGSVEKMAEKVQAPMLMCPCDGDPECVQPGGSVDKILQAKSFGKQCSFNPFLEQKHGFVTQGDLTNKSTARDVEIAMTKATEFFSKLL